MDRCAYDIKTENSNAQRWPIPKPVTRCDRLPLYAQVTTREFMFRFFFRSILIVGFLVQLSQVASAQQGPQAAESAGAAIYAQRCIKCHGAQGQGVNSALSMIAPSLQAVHSQQLVVKMVLSGSGIMPSFAHVLTPQEIDSVADYVTQRLATIPIESGDLVEGGTLFRIDCAPCHRTAARGGALAFTGTNAPSLVGKDASTIAGAIRFGPGPMPAFPPTVLSDKQLNSIVSYVRFVQHPPHPGGSALGWYGPVAEGFIGWLAIFFVVAVTGWIEKGGKG